MLSCASDENACVRVRKRDRFRWEHVEELSMNDFNSNSSCCGLHILSLQRILCDARFGNISDDFQLYYTQLEQT